MSVETPESMLNKLGSATTEGKEEDFPVVGIGASAGGFAALKQLFAHVPENSGLAFVVVMHLSPEHESHLQELLQPHAKIQVQQVRQTIKIEKNNVYVIPPNANLDAVDTHLRLSELEVRRRERAPIDHFFRTLAAHHEGHAIGVILSGTGSDGTLGLLRIKERGGLAVVQDPKEAEYDGMPQSAISAAPVDFVLPLADIPAAILRFVRTQPRLKTLSESEPVDADTQRFLQHVFAQVRARTGREFLQYKRSTMLRRIGRRMQFNQIQEPAAYLALLRHYPDEVRALADDLLINVTSFFRDSEVFAALEKQVIPQIFDSKSPNESIRVWTVGCATGEEAYSFGMLLLDEAARRDVRTQIQVFATDLHLPSLLKARNGFYLGEIEADVPAERLERYFSKERNGYRVTKELRELVVFAPHNLLSDPPFSKLDLISCRNLLIYLDRPLHQQIADLFHYSLRESGYLVLGNSENIDGAELFRVENKKCSIYRKRNASTSESRLPIFPRREGQEFDVFAQSDFAREPFAYGALHHRLIEAYGPPSVLITPDDNVAHFSAHAGRYFSHPGGIATNSIFKLAREELRVELRVAISAARIQRKSVRTKPIVLRFHSGEPKVVVLDVRPGLESEHEGFLLLVFDEHPPLSELEGQEAGNWTLNSTVNSSTIKELEDERQLVERRLQQLIEAHETHQEVIKASNEELQSANEELRSTLEELETSKEELQSMNEELQTVNQENRHKVDELDQLSSDLQNLLIATDIATLFLDRELKIMRFTPKIEDLFNVRLTDRGRALSDFTTRLGYADLTEDARKVLARLVPIENEVQDDLGHWYLTRILPYRSHQDRIAGVVVTFVEITRLKQAEEDVRRAKEDSERIIESLREPLLILTSELRIHSANTAFYEHFKVRPNETLNWRIYEIGDGQWDIPQLRTLLEDVLHKGRCFDDFVVNHEFASLGPRSMLLNARRLDDMPFILLGIHDITKRQQAEVALRQSEERFRALVMASTGVLYRMSPDWTLMYNLRGGGFLCGTDTPRRDWLEEYIPADDRAQVSSAVLKAVQERSVFELEHRVRRADGSTGWALSRAVPMIDENGQIIEWFGAATDVTERRQAEDFLRGADRRKDEYLAMLGHELRNPLGAIRSATELLKTSETSTPHLIRAYDVLKRQAGHMSRIIDGLLDVSRIARGKIHLELASVDLSDVINKVLEIRVAHMQTRQLTLITDLPLDPVWVIGDDARLAQVIDNLLGNAIKFTPAHGTITVSLSHDEKMATISVCDTGVGIRTDILPSIFDSFQQEIQDIARSAGGLGLGLALCKGLVELHQGTLEAFSAGLNAGSEFVVRLPLTVPPVSAGEDERNDEPSASEILLVEDNEDAAEMLSESLVLSGHTVSAVGDGNEALAFLRGKGAGLVICDIGLPGMNGYDFARAIRKDPELRDIPLIALTGYGQPEDRKRVIDAGFDCHFVKPIGLAELSKAIDRYGRGRV